jgi:hypothetical protein
MMLDHQPAFIEFPVNIRRQYDSDNRPCAEHFLGHNMHCKLI